MNEDFLSRVSELREKAKERDEERKLREEKILNDPDFCEQRAKEFKEENEFWAEHYGFLVLTDDEKNLLVKILKCYSYNYNEKDLCDSLIEKATNSIGD